MRQPGFPTVALVLLIGLSAWQIVMVAEMRSRLDRLEAKPSPLKQAIMADAPRVGASGPAVTANQPHPRQAATNAAGSLPPWLVARKWEEMLNGIEVWNDGKLSSRVIELGELSQSQAQQLEDLKKSFIKARREVPVLPPEVIEDTPGKVVILMNREDAATIKQLQIEQEQSLDSILGAGFDPVLRNRILPQMHNAELAEITLERVDNENFRIGRAQREADRDVTFNDTKFTASETKLPEILTAAEKAALRLAGREY